MVLRDWQVQIADEWLDPATRLLVWTCARGNAKSTTAAGLGLHHIVEGPLGATAAVVATDERAAARILRTATLMVERSPSLAKRVTPYADRLVCPRTGGELLVLPAEARRVEGGDFSAALCDEVGLMERDVWESTLLSLKRPGARALAIGTPSPPAWRERAPLFDLVTEGRLGLDPSLRLIEYGSDPTHDITCEHCWESANPGLDDLLDRDHLRSSLPPKTRRHEYERARLARWIDGAGIESWLPPGAWAACEDAHGIPDGADVVLALDGSFNQDTTALVVCTVSPRPHLAVAGLWSAPEGDGDWRVPVLAVEEAIREACRRWSVREVCADPFRWQRSLEVLAAERLPVVEFPQTAARMSPATTALREAVINRQVTHDGNADLAAHVANAVLRDDARGVRITKASKHSRRRIDLAVASVMAHSRATHYGLRPKPRRKVVTFR
jgi:phage terminase large subunit-like protein